MFGDKIWQACNPEDNLLSYFGSYIKVDDAFCNAKRRYQASYDEFRFDYI